MRDSLVIAVVRVDIVDSLVDHGILFAAFLAISMMVLFDIVVLFFGLETRLNHKASIRLKAVLSMRVLFGKDSWVHFVFSGAVIKESWSQVQTGILVHKTVRVRVSVSSFLWLILVLI